MFFSEGCVLFVVFFKTWLEKQTSAWNTQSKMEMFFYFYFTVDIGREPSKSWRCGWDLFLQGQLVDLSDKLWVWSSSAISLWRFSRRPRWHYSSHVIIFDLCIGYSMLQHMQHIWWCHLVRLSQGGYNSQIRVLLWTASNPLSLTERCQKNSTAPFFWFWFASHNPHTGPMSQCYVPWNGGQWNLNLTYSPPVLRVLGPFHNLP